MKFVNIHGEEISLGADSKTKKAASKPSGNPKHKGWYAVGYSPEQIEQGRKNHQDAEELAKKNGRPIQPFNLQTFMRLTKPSKIRVKPFATQSSAEECCRIAESQAGWINCHVRDAVTGVKKK